MNIQTLLLIIDSEIERLKKQGYVPRHSHDCISSESDDCDCHQFAEGVGYELAIDEQITHLKEQRYKLTKLRGVDNEKQGKPMNKDKGGQIKRKRGDTLVGNLEKKYGVDLGRRSDTKLSTVLKDTGAPSLSKLLKMADSTNSARNKKK